jgi:hypothetical protein
VSEFAGEFAVGAEGDGAGLGDGKGDVDRACRQEPGIMSFRAFCPHAADRGGGVFDFPAADLTGAGHLPNRMLDSSPICRASRPMVEGSFERVQVV